MHDWSGYRAVRCAAACGFLRETGWTLAGPESTCGYLVDLRIPCWNQLLPNGQEREHSEKNWAMMLDGLKKTVEHQW